MAERQETAAFPPQQVRGSRLRTFLWAVLLGAGGSLPFYVIGFYDATDGGVTPDLAVTVIALVGGGTVIGWSALIASFIAERVEASTEGIAVYERTPSRVPSGTEWPPVRAKWRELSWMKGSRILPGAVRLKTSSNLTTVSLRY